MYNGHQGCFKDMTMLKRKICGIFEDKISENGCAISMGTSENYVNAILEGAATEVRIGTKIFGKRDL